METYAEWKIVLKTPDDDAVHTGDEDLDELADRIQEYLASSVQAAMISLLHHSDAVGAIVEIESVD